MSTLFFSPEQGEESDDDDLAAPASMGGGDEAVAGFAPVSTRSFQQSPEAPAWNEQVMAPHIFYVAPLFLNTHTYLANSPSQLSHPLPSTGFLRDEQEACIAPLDAVAMAAIQARIQTLSKALRAENQHQEEDGGDNKDALQPSGPKERVIIKVRRSGSRASSFSGVLDC
jgi:hypothetical protein